MNQGSGTTAALASGCGELVPPLRADPASVERRAVALLRNSSVQWGTGVLPGSRSSVAARQLTVALRSKFVRALCFDLLPKGSRTGGGKRVLQTIPPPTFS